MRRILIAVFSVFSVLFVLAIAVGFFLSKTFVVSREVLVQASPQRVYELIGDLRSWPRWGPWKDADATLTLTYGERTSGVGASQSWQGTDGGGRLVFTEADPRTGIAFDLLFNGDAFFNTASILYEPTADGLRVVWEMQGSISAPIVGGYLAKMMPGMVGPMFDDSLARLQAAAEQTD